MNYKRFSRRVQIILQYANDDASRLNHEFIGAEHILLGLLRLGNGYAIEIMKKAGININEMRTELLEMLKPGKPMLILGQKEYTPQARQVLDQAVAFAEELDLDFVGTEHLLLGLLSVDSPIIQEIFKKYGLTLKQAEDTLDEIIDAEQQKDDFDQIVQDMESELDGFMDNGEADDEMQVPKKNVSKKKKSTTPTIDKFGTDLTELAKNGDLDPVIGRWEEIRRVIQVLSRRTKNNPVLIGDPGVGKTAIVEGLAQEIADNNVPEILLNKRIVKLELGNIVAGTKYRGQFEERIRNIIREIKKSKNIVLFIDEIHTIIGAGSAEGSLDASNMFKPALSRGELQCIGATTLDEYRKIEKDGALERRFQPILVKEPSIEETIEILKGLRPKYEEHHKIKIDDSAIKAAAELSARYITNRYLPDKAIDLIDEAGSEAHLNTTIVPQNIIDMKEELEKLTEEKDAAIKNQSFEKAAHLRDKEKELKNKYEETLDKWRTEQNDSGVVVSYYDIAKIISKTTRIPLQKLEKDEATRLLDMEKFIKNRIVGQDDAVASISRAIRRGRAGLKDPNRPVGSFLFLGPTGVGKTELSKVLAEYLFGAENSLIRIDMSEYMEKFAVSRLTGAPPGYVGYDEGGELTEKVRRQPYCVVLFDEIEKAHPDVFDILLQVLEDGRLTDSTGRVVDFKNSILILTSNAGTRAISGDKTIGIKNEERGTVDYKTLKKNVEDAAKRIFKPEFINRLDEIVVFKALSAENIKQILDIRLKELNERIKDRNLKIILSEEMKDFLIEKGFNKVMGARELRRVIQRYIEDPISEMILRGDVEGKSRVKINIKNGLPQFKALK